MRFTLAACIFFLAVEAGLAWAVSGNPFLAAAIACGLLIYAVVWKIAGPWGELVRALAAGLIAIAGPLYYRASLTPTVLCFLALPHLLAATQCFWEIALGSDPAQQNLRMRTMVFSVAFYAAMGLVFVLLRGAEPVVSAWITQILAVAVLLAAIPAWETARVARLKPGTGRPAAPVSLRTRRLVLLGIVLGMVTALFSGVLPAAAEKLCAISPRWRAKVDTPENPAPRPQTPGEQSPGPAMRPGIDSSAMTGRHELPQESDIRSTGQIDVRIRFSDRAAGARLVSTGPVYVRSHTLDAWKDEAWQPSIASGTWLKDDDDGTADGVITLRQSSLPAFGHTVFLENADGYSLPAIQGLTALRLRQVFALHGEQYQIVAAGRIRYDAVSSPVVWDQLPGPSLLRAGAAENPAQLRPASSPALNEIFYRDPLLRPEKAKNLASQITDMRQWFRDNVRYSTKMQGRPQLTALDNFLAGDRRGYCDFYASAACLMLRLNNVPTRIAYGYAGHDYEPDSGILTYTDDAAHAWTEILVEGYGWTICDFTPPANIGNLGAGPARQKNEFKENSYEDPRPKTPEPAATKPPEEFSLTAWWNNLVEKVIAMNPLELTKQGLIWLAALAAAVFLFKRLRRKKKTSAGADAFAEDERQPAYFREFIRVFTDAGCPRDGGSTPREYLSAVQSRGMAGEEFSPMISYHYRHRYADAGRDGELESGFLTIARETAERLKQSRPQA